MIQGIEPDPQKAIYFYKKIGLTGDFSILIDWANIHHYGIPGFENLEDHKKAKEIYLTLYHKTDDHYLKQQAKERLEMLGIVMESCNVPPPKISKPKKLFQ